MKTKMILAALAMLCMVSANAQDNNNEGRRQKMDQTQMVQRMAERMTKQLKLDDDKSEAFKMLYIDYQTTRMNAANPKGETDTQVDMKKLTDAQATELIQKHFAAQEAQLKVDKDYYPKFLQILTPAQTAQIYLQQGGRNLRGMGNFQRDNRRQGGYGRGFGNQGNFGVQGGPGEM